MTCRCTTEHRHHLVERAEGTLAGLLMIGGLGLTVLVATVYDVGHWVAAW